MHSGVHYSHAKFHITTEKQESEGFPPFLNLKQKQNIQTFPQHVRQFDFKASLYKVQNVFFVHKFCCFKFFLNKDPYIMQEIVVNDVHWQENKALWKLNWVELLPESTQSMLMGIILISKVRNSYSTFGGYLNIIAHPSSSCFDELNCSSWGWN